MFEASARSGAWCLLRSDKYIPAVTSGNTVRGEPWGYYRVRAVKDGFAVADQVFFSGAVSVALHPNGTVPAGMVWVPATQATQTLLSVSLPGFWRKRYA